MKNNFIFIVHSYRGFLFFLISAIIGNAHAGNITKNHTFVRGTTISSSQINSNFDQLIAELNSKETRITTLEGLGGGGPWSLNGSDVYYNAGNVGIGTTNPGFPLEVVGIAAITTLRGRTTSQNANDTLFLGDTTNQNFFIDKNVAGGQMIMGYNTPKFTSASSPLQVFNNSTDRTTMLSVNSAGTGGGANQIILAPTSGNVGIGTTNPGAKLTVNGGVSAGNFFSGVSTTNAALSFASDDSFQNAIQTWGATSANPNSIGFVTNGINTMFIRGSSIGMGGVTTPGHPLELASGAHVTVGGVWTDASDISRKKNIHELKYGLEDVLKMKPVSYDYKVNSSHSIGFIAQDMEKIIPEVVSGENGKKGIGYGLITAVIVKAIQELTIKLTRFEDEDAQMTKKLQLLEQENRQLKAHSQKNAAVISYLCKKDPKAAFCN